MKKWTSLALSILLALGVFAACDFNEPMNSVHSSSSEERDTSWVSDVPVEEMIEIRTEEELFAIKDNLAGGYRLMKDITLTKPWKTLGTAETPFTGIFDGNDYTIYNMEVESDVFSVDGTSIEYFVGMFGVLRGDVENVYFENFKVLVNEQTIAHSSYATLKAENSAVTDLDIHVGIVASNKGNIENVTADVSVFVQPNTSTARLRVGGIAGKSNDKIADCHVTGIINLKNVDGYIRAGGVAGYVSSNGKVKRSGATVDIITEIISAAKTDVGGLIGNIQCGIVEDCYSKGTIFSVNTADKRTVAGGLIGLIDNCDEKYADMSVTVTGSYSTMTVTANGGKAYAAGLIGQVDFGAATVITGNACSGVATGGKGSFGFIGRIVTYVGIQLTADDLTDGKYGTLLTVQNNQSVTQDPFATKVDSIPMM